MSAQKTIWTQDGVDQDYRHHMASPHSVELRKWVDEAFGRLHQFLDKDFLQKLSNEDFYGRLWELEVCEWLMLTDLKMIPTNGKGPDFCIKLANGSKIWIEAVLSRADEELKLIWADLLTFEGKVYSIPREQIALRYSNNLVEKSNKMKTKYAKYISKDDYALIAISAFALTTSMWTSRDLFELAILPINYQIVHFSTDGKPLPDIPRSTHEIKTQMTKRSGSHVQKEFLYPGTAFPHIDGVMFSEASNLQQLLGKFSSSFGQETNTPHIYQNYSGKVIPEDFAKFFYYHKWWESPSMMILDTVNPSS